MARIWKPPKTGVLYWRRAVRAPLRSKLGWELKRTLETKDWKEARKLYPEMAACAELRLASAEAPVRLTDRQVPGLAGEGYRRQWGRPGRAGEHLI